MRKLQTNRFFKTGIGIDKLCRGSSILKALNAPKIDNVIETSPLKLISAIFSNSSPAKTFYCHFLKKHRSDNGDQLRSLFILIW